jgi:hypothetical protein
MSKDNAPETTLADLEKEAAGLRARLGRLVADRAKMDRDASALRERLAHVHRELGRLYETEEPTTLHVGFVQDFDPERHRRRTREGVADARAQGRTWGRRPSIAPEKWDKFDLLLFQGHRIRAAATGAGISPSHAYRRVRELSDQAAGGAAGDIHDDPQVSNG